MSARPLLALLATLALPAAATEYEIDPEHTYVSFEIDHLGFSIQRGRFNRSSGSIDFDSETQSGGIEINIEAASLDTGLALRDDTLRGADWFNVKDFPNVLFRSQRFIFEQGRPVAVEGTLMLLGEIRPMRLEIGHFKCGFNLVLRKQGCGADAQGTLRRSAFGMNAGLPFIGDEVRLHIQVEAYRP
jgi:polyisoprenoid-binding protein YceI